MHQVFVLPQLQIMDLAPFLVLLLLQPLLGLHRPHPPNLLISLNPSFLEAFDGVFQLIPDADVLASQLNDPCESVLCRDSQFGQFIVQVIEFWVIGDVSRRHLYFIFLILIVDGNKSAVLPFLLHRLEDVNQVLQFFLQFF